MPEIERKVEVYLVSYNCDDCGTEIITNGMVYYSYPPKYGYVCPTCQKRFILSEKYPCQRFK